MTAWLPRKFPPGFNCFDHSSSGRPVGSIAFDLPLAPAAAHSNRGADPTNSGRLRWAYIPLPGSKPGH